MKNLDLHHSPPGTEKHRTSTILFYAILITFLFSHPNHIGAAEDKGYSSLSSLALHFDEYNIDVSVYFARNHDFKELPAKARAHLEFISDPPVGWRDISLEGYNEVDVTANFVRSFDAWSIGEIASSCPENARCQSLQPDHYGATKIAGAAALTSGNPSFPKGYQVKDDDARSDVLYDVTWSGRFPSESIFYFAESLPPERGLSRVQRNFVARALEKILTVQE